MPARKPKALNNSHTTKKQNEKRDSAENAIAPTTELTVQPPKELENHTVAQGVWRRLISLYAETEGRIITAFDMDLLVKYCLAEEELIELATLRSEVKEQWTHHTAVTSEMEPDTENLKDYFGALTQTNALLRSFKDIDARLDGKRKMVFTLAQSLYLTPRSRAGVAPPEKEPEEPESEMDKLLK